MAQYFAPPEPKNQMYGIFGSVLGELGNYALHEYQKPEKEKQFKNFGATDNEAKFLVNASPQVQGQWVQQKMKDQRQQQVNSMFGSIFGGGDMNPQQDISSIPGGDIAARLGGLSGPQVQTPPGQTFTPEQEQEIIQKAKGMTPQQIDQVLKSGIFNPNLQLQIKGVLDRQLDREFKERAHGEKLSERRREQEQNRQEKATALASKEKAQAFKMTEPYRAEVFKKEENARHMDDVIGEQLELSKSGKMTPAGFIEFLDRFGMNYNAVKSTATQKYEALEKEYLKDLKSIFGGKISNDEMKAFLKGIPKATNSPEAREHMLQRWRAYYEAKGLEAKLVREITKKNDGVPPYDLRDQVAARLNEEHEKLARTFLGVPEGAELYYDDKTGEKAYVDKKGKLVQLV